MSISEVRAKIKASVWQAVAQSKVDVSGLPEGGMDKLVGAITENILKDLDEVIGQVSGRPASSPVQQLDEADEAEQVLWEGRPYLSLSVLYQITSERVRITQGLLGKDREDIELVRIQDVDMAQNMTERMLNIGDIFIRSHDASHSEVTLNNVQNPIEVHEILRRAVLRARKRHNFMYREQM